MGVRITVGIFIITFAIMFFAIRCPVHAQQSFTIQIELECNTTKNIIKYLHEKYKEVSTGGGMSSREQVRLFESHNAGDKQTWTLVISNVNGISCIIKGGQDWITDPSITKGEPL